MKTSVVLQLLGGLFEVAGVYLMASRLLSTTTVASKVSALLSALLRGRTASNAVTTSELNPEDKLRTLQGLAFIAVGFILQAVGNLIALLC